MKTITCQLTSDQFIRLNKDDTTCAVSSVDDRYFLFVSHDTWPESPKKYDGSFLNIEADHRRYDLSSDNPEFTDDDFSEGVLEFHLFAYEHSDISLSLAPYSCKWDSYRIGTVRVPIKPVKKWFMHDEDVNVHNLESLTAKVRAHIVNELKLYTAYLNGEIYQMRIIDLEAAAEDTIYGLYFIGSHGENEKNMMQILQLSDVFHGKGREGDAVIQQLVSHLKPV